MGSETLFQICVLVMKKTGTPNNYFDFPVQLYVGLVDKANDLVGEDDLHIVNFWPNFEFSQF